MNSFLLTIAGFLILVLSAAFAVPHLIDWASYRYVFEAEATRLVGRTVGVGGDVRLSLLPTPVLRFEGVEVADAKGSFERPLAKAKSLTIWLSISPLLSGTLEAREIEIEKPILNLSVDEEGRGNWHDLGNSAATLPFAPKAVAFEAVNIVDASVTLRRGGDAEPWSVNGLTGVLSARSLDGPFKFTGEYEIGKTSREIRFSTSRREDDGTFRLKGLVREPGKGTNYAVDGAFTGFTDTPQFDGMLSAQVASDGDLLRADKKGVEVPIEIKTTVSASLRGARFDKLEATLRRKDRPQTINGSVSATWHDGVRLDANIGTRWFNFDPILAGDDSAQKSPTNALAMLADRALSQASQFRSGRLRLAIDQAILAGDIVNDFAVDFSIDGEGLELANVSGRLPGENEVALKGRLESEETGPIFDGDVTLVGRKMNRLLRWAGWQGEALPATAETAEFSIQAALSASPQELILEKVTGTALDTAFTGSMRYETAPRREFSLTLDSDRFDMVRLLGPSVTPRSLLAGVLGEPTDNGKEGKTKSPENESASWWQRTAAEFDLRIGTLIVPDVGDVALDAKVLVAEGNVDIRRLVVSSKTGLVVRAEGALSSVGGQPDGKLTMSVDGPKRESLEALVALLEIPRDKVGETQLDALSPMRIVMALESKGEGDRALEARIGGTLGVSNVSLTGRYQGDLAAFESAELGLRGTVSNQDGRALVSQLFSHMTPESLKRLGAERGILSLSIDGTVASSLETRLSLDAAGIKLVLDGKSQWKDGGLQLGGRTALRAEDFAAGLVLAGYDLGPQDVPQPVALRAQLAKAGMIYEFSELNGQIGEEALKGRLRVDLSKSVPVLDADLNVSRSSLAGLLSPTVDWRRKKATRPSRRKKSKPYWSEQNFASDFLAGISGQIALKAGRLELADALVLQDAAFEAVLADGTLNIKTLKGSLFEGKFDATAKLVRRGANLALVGKATAADLRLDRITGLQRDAPLADGKMDIEFALAGEGLSPKGLTAGLTGQGKVRFSGGTLSGLSPDVLRQFIDQANTGEIKKTQPRKLRSQVVLAMRDARFEFSEAATEFVVRNGTATFEDMILKNDGGQAKVTSFVELTNLKLDSEWVLETPVDAQTQIEPRITMTFAGPVAEFGRLNPDVDTQSLERYLTMRRMERDVERLEKLQVPKAPEPATALPGDGTTTGVQGGAEPQGGAPLDVAPRTDNRQPADPSPTGEAAALPAPSSRQPSALGVAPVRDAATETPRTTPLQSDQQSTAPARVIPQRPEPPIRRPAPTARPEAPAVEEAAAPAAPRVVTPPPPNSDTVVTPLGVGQRIPGQTAPAPETPSTPGDAIRAEQRAERADEPAPQRPRDRSNVLDLLRDFSD